MTRVVASSVSAEGGATRARGAGPHVCDCDEDSVERVAPLEWFHRARADRQLEPAVPAATSNIGHGAIIATPRAGHCGEVGAPGRDVDLQLTWARNDRTPEAVFRSILCVRHIVAQNLISTETNNCSVLFSIFLVSH